MNWVLVLVRNYRNELLDESNLVFGCSPIELICSKPF